MAESMESIVVALVVIAIVIVVLSHRFFRDHHRERSLGRLDGHHRLWDRVRHRH